MDENYKIKVLWVDDEPNEDFMNEAYEEGLDLDNVICVEDGIANLNDPQKSYDAIILDGNCRIKHDMNEQPSLNALRDAIAQLLEMHTEIPWFVYTAANYEGKDALKYMIKDRAYDDRPFYVKSADRYIMYDHIKRAVANMPTTIVKEKYADVLKIYSGDDMIQLLVRREEENIGSAVDIPNKVRGVLDWIMAHLNEIGMLPVLFTKSNLNDCSRCLGSMDNDIVPVYIKCCFEHCVRVSNEGSHHELPTYQLLSKGKAPYLNESLIVDLLNILHWCGIIDEPKDELQKKTISSYTKNKRNNVQHYGRVVCEGSVRFLRNDLKGDINLNTLDPDKFCKEGYMYAYIYTPKENKFIPLAYI